LLTLEKQILVVNTIVESLEELIKILKMNTKINDQIHRTIGEIIKFMGKVLNNFPEMLISKRKVMFTRKEMLQFYNDVLKSWESYFDDPESFFLSFYTFSIIWKDYQKYISKIEKNATTIFLSLN